MGKLAGVRKKSAGPVASLITPFFTASGPRQESANPGSTEDKMAGATQAVGGDSVIDAINRSEWRIEHSGGGGGFQRMEATLLEKLTAIIAPLTAQLQEVKQSVDQIAKTVDSGMELAITNQESSQQQQNHQEWATEKIMTL